MPTEIADALGDVDALIEQYDEHARKVPKITAEIAASPVRRPSAGSAADVRGLGK
jgi:hypothetical protein